MSWISTRSPEVSLVLLRHIASECAKLGGPISKYCYNLVESKSYLELIKFKIDYEVADVDDAKYARQIQALFSKLEKEVLDLGVNTREVAYDLFLANEEKCRVTNQVFKHRATPYSSNTWVETVLYRAQQKIASILGPVPSLDDFDFSFGPGANTNVNSRRSNPRVKLSATMTCSENLTPTVGEFLAEVPHWTALHSNQDNPDSYMVEVTVSAGKLAFVPKTALTDRAIMVEPLLNGFFQKGVGTYIRDRLLRSGIDLRDQRINQKLAKIGSETGNLATVDLSSASDLIARNLVWSLLPIDWACLLDNLRTSSVYLEDGTKTYLEKFSSMGNAFTFELESLIFYGLAFGAYEAYHGPAITEECGSQEISVYGDDIITSSASYPVLKEVLEYCGFEVNLSKSYNSGPFRESCGADYLRGFDIRPFYQKTLISDRTLFTMHNWMIRAGEFELAQLVHSFTRPSYRLYGPDGFGDGHLLGNYDLRLSRKYKRLGWSGGFFDTYSLRPMEFKSPLIGDSVFPVYSVYTRSGKDRSTDPNIVRGSRGYAKISIYTHATHIFGNPRS
nr:MAG: RNA dependent RNA polymerase [Leviviridae sp.]